MALCILTADAPMVSFPPLGSNLNVLLVWPRFPPSFWGLEGVLQMLPEDAITPPLGLITVAPAHIRPGLSVVERRTLHAALVFRPTPRRGSSKGPRAAAPARLQGRARQAA